MRMSLYLFVDLLAVDGGDHSKTVLQTWEQHSKSACKLTRYSSGEALSKQGVSFSGYVIVVETRVVWECL